MSGHETFSGQWTVEVIDHQSSRTERFAITNSDAGDTWHDGVVGVGPISVSGPEWVIRAEWDEPAGATGASDLTRLSVSYTLADGLVVIVGVDSNSDGDYNDLVLRCASDDPRITPWRPVTRPHDFTLPKDVYEKRHKEPPKRRRNKD